MCCGRGARALIYWAISIVYSNWRVYDVICQVEGSPIPRRRCCMWSLDGIKVKASNAFFFVQSFPNWRIDTTQRIRASMTETIWNCDFIIYQFSALGMHLARGKIVGWERNCRSINQFDGSGRVPRKMNWVCGRSPFSVWGGSVGRWLHFSEIYYFLICSNAIRYSGSVGPPFGELQFFV